MWPCDAPCWLLQYEVKVSTNKRGTSSVWKRYSHVCELEAQLRKLFPGTTIPEGAKLRAAEVMCTKKSARVMELRRIAMEEYLQALLGAQSACMLLLTWLFPGKQIGLQEDDAAKPDAPATASSGAGAGAGRAGEVRLGVTWPRLAVLH